MHTMHLWTSSLATVIVQGTVFIVTQWTNRGFEEHAPKLKEHTQGEDIVVAVKLIDKLAAGSRWHSSPDSTTSMQQKLIKVFIKTAGCLLFVTSAAKLFSSIGSANVLSQHDPVLLISFRHLLQAAALVELCVAVLCIYGNSRVYQCGAVAILSINILLYRFGLYWIGFHGLCPCLGNLSDMLPVPPQAIDTAMKILLAFLFMGSCGSLFLLCRHHETPKPIGHNAPA